MKPYLTAGRRSVCVAAAISMGMGAAYVCGAAGGAAGSGTAPVTAPGQQTSPAGNSVAPASNGTMQGATNGMTPGMTNGLLPRNGGGTPGLSMTGATNGVPSGNSYFTPYGSRGYYQLGTNGGFLRGTNGFYQPGTNGSRGEFIPDGGDLYERGPDGLYHRDNRDDSRGVYRNGVLYSPTNMTAPMSDAQTNSVH